MQTPNYSKQRDDEIYNQWHYETNVKPRLPKEKRKTRSKKEIRDSISFKTIVNRDKKDLILEI